MCENSMTFWVNYPWLVHFCRNLYWMDLIWNWKMIIKMLKLYRC